MGKNERVNPIFSRAHNIASTFNVEPFKELQDDI